MAELVGVVYTYMFVECFDIFIIHRKKDRQKVLKLQHILSKFVILPGNRRLTFCLEDIGVPYINVKLDYFEKSLQQSRYKFIYIGADFSSESHDADDDEFKWRLYQHYALNDMIRKEDSSVVPVTDSPRTKIPTLLDIFRRLDVWKLLKQRSLDDVTDVDILGDDDVDEYVVKFVYSMFHPAPH